MTASVGIVIVSHSIDVAKGAADMVRQMVGEEVRVAYCGGNAEGGLGTDVTLILHAINSIWSPVPAVQLLLKQQYVPVLG